MEEERNYLVELSSGNLEEFLLVNQKHEPKNMKLEEGKHLGQILQELDSHMQSVLFRDACQGHFSIVFCT